jgi:hypothetical protein
MTMDCRTAIESIARAQSGAFTRAERHELDAHAATCSRCRAEEALQAALEIALAADGVPAPGDDFTAQVLARIRAGERRHRVFAPAALVPARLFVRLAPAAALAATIAGFSFLDPDPGGHVLLAFLTSSLPHLDPAVWASLVAGAGLAALGTYQATAFFAES